MKDTIRNFAQHLGMDQLVSSDQSLSLRGGNIVQGGSSFIVDDDINGI